MKKAEPFSFIKRDFNKDAFYNSAYKNILLKKEKKVYIIEERFAHSHNNYL
jgi:hypothetical protein